MLRQDLPPENIYGHTKKLRFIQQHLDAHRRATGRPITLLDFGCGNGAAVSQFLMDEGIDFVGVDFHEPSLSYAREHFGSARARFHAEVPPESSFDVVVYADVLEHLDDPLGVLLAHRERLREGGLVIGSVPNGYGPFENEKRIVRWFQIDELLRVSFGFVNLLTGRRPGTHVPNGVPPRPYNEDSGHVQFYTRSALLRLLRRAGLRVEGFEHGAFLGAPLSEEFLLGGGGVARCNARWADRLPYWAVSAWYFVARKRSGGPHDES